MVPTIIQQPAQETNSLRQILKSLGLDGSMAEFYERRFNLYNIRNEEAARAYLEREIGIELFLMEALSSLPDEQQPNAKKLIDALPKTIIPITGRLTIGSPKNVKNTDRPYLSVQHGMPAASINLDHAVVYEHQGRFYLLNQTPTGMGNTEHNFSPLQYLETIALSEGSRITLGEVDNLSTVVFAFKRTM